MITIVDYGMGNIRSLSNAFEYIGCEVSVASNPQEIHDAERIVLPGVGAFGDAMSALRERELEAALEMSVLRGGKPMLAICLGMQLLATSSVEHGEHRGLGWIDASIERFEAKPGLKVPHIGWNSIDYRDDEFLFKGLRAGSQDFYFVHSYRMQCRESEVGIATCEYGGRFTAAVRKANIVATQFHPEKSQDNGIQLLQNFVSWSP